MADLVEDFAALAADVAALAQQAQSAGWRLGVSDEALPAVAEPPRPEAAPGWAELAQAGRVPAPRPAAAQLEQIRAELGDCRRCGLCARRRQIVFGVGDPEADLVVIGEAPGQQEDVRGEPFVGPAGEMLDKMLVNVLGLERGRHVYIMNMVKCRPPDNRNPLPEELAACRPFLDAQLEALQPKVILVLGGVAFKALFDTTEGIMRARGAWREHRGVPVMPTFHPAYLLRQPQDKRLTFADLKVVRERYDALGGRR